MLMFLAVIYVQCKRGQKQIDGRHINKRSIHLHVNATDCHP